MLSGVPQGTVLGPLMFLLYINDMPSQVHPDTRCRLFADDSLLYRAIDTIADQIQLQEDLKKLQQWASDWGMIFNPTKCYVMTINRGRSQKTHFYELCDVVLSSVEHEKYLGVTLCHDLSWTSHVDVISTKANQKLGFIKRNLKGSPQELKRLAYIAMVRSSMEYASSIWDPHLKKNQQELEKVQRRAARWIKHNYDTRETSVTDLLRQLKLEPLEERRRINRLTFMYKILNEHVAVPPERLDLIANPRPPRGGKTTNRIKVPSPAKTSEYRHSFPLRTIPEWNDLQDTTTSAASVSAFRSRVVAAKSP